jgi:adenine-specific DNA-methyltransferase
MEKLDPKTDGATPDIVGQNIEKLKTLFPDVFTEGKVDLDTLRETLGDYADERQERYSFTWNGKACARRIAQTPSTGTLRPCLEESINWSTARNLFIEGDNLEVLKLLQKSYHKKIKMIYIDPPYNTGNEFIYPDKYQDNLQTYLRYTGQVDDEGFKLSANAETGGRYHTNWLNMMLPRLKLARNLLTEDGYIVVSIDDVEVSSLSFLLSEVMGEENKIATLVWDRNRKNDAHFFSVGHEYMLIYAKHKKHLVDLETRLREPKEGIEEARVFYERLRRKHGTDAETVQEEWREHFRSIPEASPVKKLGRYSKIGPKGPYRDDGNISWPGGGGPTYEVIHPKTKKPCKVPDGGWRYSKPDRFWEEVDAGRVVFGPDETTLPRQCRHLFDGNGQVMPSVFYSYAQTAALEFNSLMGSRAFENPKNWRDLHRLIRYLTSSDSVILDFFSGSCSTAHGVLRANEEDHGSRSFIMVQLPEPCGDGTEAKKIGYQTIADIGKERIRRVIKKLEAEQEEKAKEAEGELPGTSENLVELDLGFKVFKLDASNIKPWDADFDNLEAALFDAVENVKPDRSETDVLYELLLKYGLDLAVPIEERMIAGKSAYIIGAGALIVCLAKKISLVVVEGIAALREELKPELMRVVFKDSGFADDVVKTNAVQILRQAGIEDVKSL